MDCVAHLRARDGCSSTATKVLCALACSWRTLVEGDEQPAP